MTRTCVQKKKTSHKDQVQAVQEETDGTQRVQGHTVPGSSYPQLSLEDQCTLPENLKATSIATRHSRRMQRASGGRLQPTRGGSPSTATSTREEERHGGTRTASQQPRRRQHTTTAPIVRRCERGKSPRSGADGSAESSETKTRTVSETQNSSDVPKSEEKAEAASGETAQQSTGQHKRSGALDGHRNNHVRSGDVSRQHVTCNRPHLSVHNDSTKYASTKVHGQTPKHAENCASATYVG